MGPTSNAKRTVRLTRYFTTKNEAEAFLDGLTYLANPLVAECMYGERPAGVWEVVFYYKIEPKPKRGNYLRSFFSWLLTRGLTRRR